MEKNKCFEVVKKAAFSVEQEIEVSATAVGKSKHVSLLDACTCTGNCDAPY